MQHMSAFVSVLGVLKQEYGDWSLSWELEFKVFPLDISEGFLATPQEIYCIYLSIYFSPLQKFFLYW